MCIFSLSLLKWFKIEARWLKSKIEFMRCVLSFLLVALSFFSCSKTDEGEKEEELNPSGEVFMNLVMQREDWETEWEAVKRLGVPLPNRSRHEDKYYILPVQAGKDTYYIIFYPVEITEEAEKLGAPLYSGETCTGKELNSSIRFIVGEKDWEIEEPRIGEIVPG